MKKLAPVITIDGSSGAGKSILCKNIAEALKWNSLESGFIYRLVSFIILKNKISIGIKNIHIIEKHLNSYLFFENNILKNIISNKILEKKLMLQDIANLSSKIATLPYIRKLLFDKQKMFRRFPGLVTNGRDMGTVIFPDAKIKFFLDADINIRVKRRVLELHNKGINANFNTILFDMKERDQRDRKRLYSPLLVAKDAIIINSTNSSIEEVFNTSIQFIYKKFKLNLT
ncbi:(d)CMP kinase [Buchnera aphidicola]|uniref:(d)CMP kinase n=1 Tax=Buchnera aphidicola TaxID=9 RepID=UPI0034645E5E